MKTMKKAQSGTKLPIALQKTGKPSLKNSGFIPDTDKELSKVKKFNPSDAGFKSVKDSTYKPSTRRYKNGGKMVAKNGKSFPDLNKDGKITKADILKGRGVIAKKGATIKKAQDGDYVPGLAERAGPMVKTKTKLRSPDGNYVTKKVTTNKPNSKNSTTKTRRTLQGFITGAPRVNDLKNGGKMKKCKYGCK